MTALIPSIKWSQNDEYVIINLEINQVKNDVYEINNNNIVFSGISNTDLKYSINLELLNEINKDESKYILEERIIRFILKKTSDEKWIRLTNDKNQYKSNIKVNWDSFEDSDEDIEEPEQNSPNNQQFDFSNMMNMGGDDNEFNMEEMMKNMNPNEMEELMKSMNMGGSGDNNDDDNNDDDNNSDDDDNNDDDNNDNDNDDNDDNNDENDEDKELDDELNNIINNNDYEEESFDSDDLCQDCVTP
jgi:hypothetical protein